MTSPLPLPDWVPWWVHLVVLVVAMLFGVLFLLMPFSVFGVKGRLESLEMRLDEIQGEIRSLSLRLPEPDLDADGGVLRSSRYDGERPPIPPAPRERPPAMPSRTEPRLY